MPKRIPNKKLTKQELDEIAFKKTKEFQSAFANEYHKRRIEYFARVLNLGKLPTNKIICGLLGVNDKIISVAKYREVHYGEKMSEKNKFVYRALKNLNPAIISFLLDDRNFDSKFRVKGEKRMLMREALQVCV